MGDKGLDLLPASFLEGLGATEISGVGLNEIGIEVVLADQDAKPVSQLWLTVI
jgi:hypothetical protein